MSATQESTRKKPGAMIAQRCMGRNELTPDELDRPGPPGLSLTDILVQVFPFSPLPSHHPCPLDPITSHTSGQVQRKTTRISDHSS